MMPETGEIIDSGRSNIRIHGGRQESFDESSNNWFSTPNPTLKKTNGCLRAYDADMKQLKFECDLLQNESSMEKPGKVSIFDDLLKTIEPASNSNMVEIKSSYYYPSNSTFKNNYLWEVD